MKKIFSISLLLGAALAFTACVNEEDDLFDKSAAERLNEASALYSSRLEASPNGWLMQYYPQNTTEFPEGNGYLMLANFTKDRSVRMAMRNIFSGNKYIEDRSAWQVVTDNGPVLSFNSYNSVIHSFSNPEDIPFTGTTDRRDNEQGKGCGGDYEFVIVQAPEDGSYIMLKGKKRGTYTLLTPLEDTDYEKYLNDVWDFTNMIFSPTASNIFKMTIGGNVFDFEKLYASPTNGGYAPNAVFASLYPEGTDKIRTASTQPFLVSKRGGKYYLRFRNELTFVEGSPVQEYVYDEENDIFKSVGSEGSVIQSSYATAIDFFKETVGSHSYKIGRTGTMSDKMRSCFNDVHNVINEKNKTYSVDTLKLDYDADTQRATWSFRYGKAGSKPAGYYYNMTTGDNMANFAYVGPDSNPASTSMLNLPAVSTLMTSVLANEFNVVAYRTKFNIGELKFTSTTDPDIWFVLYY